MRFIQIFAAERARASCNGNAVVATKLATVESRQGESMQECPLEVFGSNGPGGANVNVGIDSVQLRDPQYSESILHEENKHLRERVKVLCAEIATIAASIVTVEAEDRTLAERERTISLAIPTLEAKKDALLDAINNFRWRNKAVQSDKRAGTILQSLLLAELDNCVRERGILLRKLRDFKDGIQHVERYREGVVLPSSQQQDDLLRQAYLLLKETRNRIELSVMLRDLAIISPIDR